MYEWHNKIQLMINEIDAGIKRNDDEALSLSRLSAKLGYSEFYLSRKFREISGMQFRDYLRYRRLAFALKELRDTEAGCWKSTHAQGHGRTVWARLDE